MEIRCRKCDCVHNTGSSCRAKTVNIADDTAECDTFLKDSGKHGATVRKGKLFESAKHLKPTNTRSVPLVCRATNCLFNRRENCVANGICVVDDTSISLGKKPATRDNCGASCATFIEE